MPKQLWCPLVRVFCEYMIFFKHLYVLTNFVVLILDSHLNFSLEKVNHIVRISHFRHIFLLTSCYTLTVVAFVETVVENHTFIGSLWVSVGYIPAYYFGPLFLVKTLKKLVLAQPQLLTSQRREVFSVVRNLKDVGQQDLFVKLLGQQLARRNCQNVVFVLSENAKIVRVALFQVSEEVVFVLHILLTLI